MQNRKHFGILIAVTALITMAVPVYAQSRISGFVTDRITGERLIGANVTVDAQKGGTSADNNGYFSLVASTPCKVKVSFVGYRPFLAELAGSGDTLLAFAMEPGGELKEVVITGQRRTMPNVSTLGIREFRKLPALGGRTDVLKGLQLMPGIQAQNEGSSLLLVRGGDPGQNLYLFDNVPVIYVNHLGGFMSVFNPDIINSIDLYKGGFPARFGGRLSSVVDITQREGDRTSLKGSLSLGITDAGFTLEGPTKLKNSSFIITGRKTFIDPIMMLGTWISDGNDFVVGYGFHDLNGKFTWKPDERNSFHLNLYQGDDYLNYWVNHKSGNESEISRLRNSWGNWLASGRWNRILSPKAFLSNTLSYTRYRLSLFQSYVIQDTARHPIFDRNYRSSVEDLSLRSSIKYQVLKGWSLETGLQASLLNHVPNSYYQSNLAVQPATERLRALETALYTDNKINVGERTEINLGLRLVYYATSGFGTLSLEPRLRAGFRVAPENYLHIGYQRVTQNDQLLFTNGSIMNSEVWVPAGPGLEPARSEQITAGWTGVFGKGMYSAGIDLYSKSLSNLATYREGYGSLMGDTDWRRKIIGGGTGKSVGIEFLLKKQLGDFTGFVSYAWSHTTRQYPDINKGIEYLFEYDRPHTVSLNINHEFNDRWAVSLTWVYQTGLPYTPVLGRQLTLSTEPDENGDYNYYEALLYGDRNSARMKDYHRLDIGATLNTLTHRGRRATWTFSVYNLYNRHNPFYYYYGTDQSGQDYDRPEYWTSFKPTNLYQMSFFPVIPSVSYKLYFSKSDPARAKKTVNENFTKWLFQEKDGRATRYEGLKSRWNVKVGFNSYPGLAVKRYGMKFTYGHWRAEASYGILKFLEVGGYAGYSSQTAALMAVGPLITSDLNTPFLGAGFNFHPLGFLNRHSDLRFDLYLLGRYGGLYYNSPPNYYPKKGLWFQYEHGAGAAFYLWKHVGLFAEYLTGSLATDGGVVRYGLSVKF
jgi:hypothetical protein